MDRYGLSERKRRSFGELALEGGAWAEDDVVSLVDGMPSSEPDRLLGASRPNLLESSLPDDRAGLLSHTRDRGRYGAPEGQPPANSFEVTAISLPLLDHLALSEAPSRELSIAPDRAFVSAATRPEAKALSSATTPSYPDMAELLHELARLLGRSWSRDRRERMGEGLGGGLRAWRGL